MLFFGGAGSTYQLIRRPIAGGHQRCKLVDRGAPALPLNIVAFFQPGPHGQKGEILEVKFPVHNGIAREGLDRQRLAGGIAASKARSL